MKPAAVPPQPLRPAGMIVPHNIDQQRPWASTVPNPKVHSGFTILPVSIM
jgi:hypothetical protein